MSTHKYMGVSPSEYHPHRPPAPFRKGGKVKTAIIVAILIVLLDLFIYFVLLKQDDTQLLKAIEPLKPPTSTPIPAKPTEIIQTIPTPNVKAVTQLAIEDLAKKLKVSASEIKVISEEKITWNDGSMGCPKPDMMYTQALIEGTKIVLSAKNKSYDYHAGINGEPFLCEKVSR